MTIEAKVIADSINGDGKRITTLQLVYPRFIHAEFMTHRVFSRNASSSRAIPVEKMIKQVRDNPAMPIHWGKNQPGMQAHEEHEALVSGLRDKYGNPFYAMTAKEAWSEAAERAADIAQAMSDAGYHKQVVNRILEPFQWIHVIVTATEWENFFILRDHPDAQPEIRALAKVMKAAMESSTPKLLQVGEWHLPYITEDELNDADLGGKYELLRKVSAARCARVSYLTHDGKKPELEKDLALYDRLITAKPMHASPIEHQATPNKEIVRIAGGSSWLYDPWLHGNFKGWVQFRKLVEKEAA